MNAFETDDVVVTHADVPQAAHVVFSGGGTAGHLFPGLAVAECLRQSAPDVRITFAGSGKEFERRHVGRAGFDYLALPCQPLPKSARDVWRFLADHFAGARAAASFMGEQHVSLVVGLGGYASVPMGRAAARRGVPLVLLEQNAFPGRATRHLASRADLICLSLAKAKLHLRTRGRVLVTGNPVRREFTQDAPSTSIDASLSDLIRKQTLHRLVVLGGSGGSSELNRVVPKALHKVRSLLEGWQIVHQSGHADRAETETLYRKLGLGASVVPFVTNMSQVLRFSDLAICRAGGTTLAELAAVGVPAILFPWSAAASDHQRRNAEVYTRIGAAATVDVAAAIGRLDDALAELLVLPLTQAEVRVRMAAAMLRMSQPDATSDIVGQIQQILATSLATAAA